MVFCFVLFLFHPLALEMTLDLETRFVPSGHTTCGVLRCREEGVYPRINVIAEMEMFRRRSSADQSVKIATVSKRKQTLSRMWSGLKVDGIWAKQKAEITLHLVEEVDCRQAEFTCRVSAVDGLGLHRVSESRVGGSGDITDEPDVHLLSESDATLTGSSALQLSAIIQQTHSSLEGALRQLQARFDDTSRLSENRLEDKLSKLEDTVARWERNIDTLRAVCPNVSSISQINEKLKNTSERMNSIETNVVALQTNMKEISQSNTQIGMKVESFNSLSENQVKDIYQHSMNISESLRASVLEVLHSSQAIVLSKLDNPADLVPGKLSRCEKDAFAKPSLTAYHVIIPEDQDAPYLCDTATRGGGWIVIQRRSTGNVDFFQDWATYKAGFGALDDDFWLGNEKIYTLTSKQPHEMIVSLKFNGIFQFAHYDYFSLGDEASGYKLNIGKYSGTAGNSMLNHRNMPFSTFDKDHDFHKTSNCAQENHGAWWYHLCHSSNLNGRWGDSGGRGATWSSISRSQSVTFSEMKIRPLPD